MLHLAVHYLLTLLMAGAIIICKLLLAAAASEVCTTTNLAPIYVALVLPLVSDKCIEIFTGILLIYLIFPFTLKQSFLNNFLSIAILCFHRTMRNLPVSGLTNILNINIKYSCLIKWL